MFWGSVHHYWVSALIHTKFHFREEPLLYRWSCRSPDVCFWLQIICVIDLYVYVMFPYICLNFVSSGLMPNFMLFVFKRPKRNKTPKNNCNNHISTRESSAMMSLACVLLLFFSRFLNCSLQEQIFNSNWTGLEGEKPFHSFELRCRDSS